VLLGCRRVLLRLQARAAAVAGASCYSCRRVLLGCRRVLLQLQARAAAVAGACCCGCRRVLLRLQARAAAVAGLAYYQVVLWLQAWCAFGAGVPC
jgi:hypothetical protein